MTLPRDQIAGDIQHALRAGDGERVSTLRLLLASLDNERIRSGQDVDATSFLRLVQKAIKQRQESAGLFEKGGRAELAAKEVREADLLRAYLPPAIDDEEIKVAITEFVEAEKLSGPQAIGQVMKVLLPRYAGRVDGGTLNRLTRQVLDAQEP